MKLSSPALLLLLICATASSFCVAESAPSERTFPQKSPAAVDKALKSMQPSTAGKLPALEGFVVPGNRSLDRFQRGYYQCTIKVTGGPSGGAVVQVSAKITAWYNDPDPSKSGYQVLPSNGRLESDFLDQLADALGSADASSSAAAPVAKAPVKAAKPSTPLPTLSAPMPQENAPVISSSKSAPPPPAASFKVGAPGSEETESLATRRAVTDKHAEELRKEAKNLEEILHSQTHPQNLAAVRKAQTPVVVSPNEGAKVVFLAAAEDEFEILDMNANWVHVRISGLNRGWIRRTSLELPEESASEPAPAKAETPAAAPASAGPLFQVENEEIASFPGSWAQLRGKTVKIVTVQSGTGHGSDNTPQAKLQFTKSLFGKEYAELTKESSTASGVVVVFDSADGGMIAATVSVLQQWKNGDLSDDGLWHRCYIDPPELYQDSSSQ